MLFPPFCVAQKSHIHFDHVGVEQGLSDNTVNDALQDDDGNVWLATSRGLNRYDGKTCTVFTSVANDPLSLDYVSSIVIDHSQKLWICTYTKGLFYYDLKKETFTKVAFPDTNAALFNYKNSFRQIKETSNRDLWALGPYGIARYIHKSNIWKWYTRSLDSFVFTGNHGNCLLETRDSVLFVGFFNSGTICYYDKKNDGFRAFKGRNEQHKPVTKSVISIVDDSYGNLWFGSDEEGLVCYNKNDDTWKQYRANKSTDSLQSNEIASLFEDSEHILWIGTVNGGLSRFDRKRKAFITLKTNVIDENSFSSISIISQFEDKARNIFFSTSNGLYILNRCKNTVTFHAKTIDGNKTIYHNQSSAFYQSPDGIVWIGTDGEGLQSFNPQTGKCNSYNTENGFPSNVILKIEPNGDGQLWLATWSNGIMLFNPKTGACKTFTSQNSGLSCNNIKGLCKNGNYLWVGTHGNGLNIYDCHKNTFYNKEHASSLFNFSLNNPTWINDIYKDSYGYIWIASNVGLCQVHGNTVHQYRLNPNAGLSISGDNVRKIFEDSKKNIWICSNGLDLYDRANNRFIRMNNRNKDFPSVVNSIEEDNENRYWLSSNDGLYCFDYTKNTVKRYNESSDFRCNRFIGRASLKTADGLLYFGCYSGFTVFNPLQITDSIQLSNVVIRSCRNLLHSHDNKSTVQHEFIHDSPINIPFNESKTLIFEFVSANIITSEIINYSTHLEGFETVDRQLGKQNSVTYTNLSPGQYTLIVKEYNSRRKEQVKTAQLHFTILCPWYMTWIFRIFLVVVVISLIWLFFYFRTRLLAQRNEMLSNLVKERTVQLEERTVQLEEQNTIINVKNKDLSEIIETRDKLLAIISHDLKNPVGALCGFTSLIEENYDIYPEIKRKRFIAIIHEASESIKLQVLNLLDWTLSQSGKLVCIPIECNLRLLLHKEITFLLPSARQKDIKLNLSIDINQSIFADARMVSTVIRNLVGNSIKFSHKGGEINITATKSNNSGIFSVQDFGVGIDEGKISQFFTNKTISSTTGTQNEMGTGLGLQVCKEFIEKNKGTIEIKSEPLKGTIISISLPLGTHFFDDSPKEEF